MLTIRKQKLTLLHLFTDRFHKEILLTLQNKCEVSARLMLIAPQCNYFPHNNVTYIMNKHFNLSLIFKFNS